jgi:Uma2 family endonuclease
MSTAGAAEGGEVVRVAPAPTLDDPYPASDGKPMAETQVHVALLASRYEMLWLWLRPRGIYVAANMFLYYKRGDIKARKAPDLMAIKGVDVTVKRRSFKTWEEKAVPCWVLELTSKKTAKEDQLEKMALYRRLRVREYFLFDPLNEYLPQQLIGYRLVGSDYQAMPLEDDGGLTSRELSLRFVPDGDQLAVFDVESGQRLLNLEEAQERSDFLQQHNQTLQEEKDEAQRRAQRAEKKLAEQVRKLLEAEAELARLRKGKSS